MHRIHRRHGLTLVELLVCIAVIALLIAIFLPSIESQRHPSKRTDCKNNLKQIGLALHNYHDVWKCFPPGMAENHASWSIALLPYLEERALYEAFDFNASSITNKEVVGAPLSAREVTATPLQVFRCPADSVNGQSVERLSLSNYPGVFGADAPRAHSVYDTANGGVFGYAASLSIRDMKDGASNTLVVGERCIEGTDPIFDNMTVWSSPKFYGNDRASLLWGWGTDRLQSGKTGSFSSAHKGGALFLFGDGRVEFISDDVDFRSTGVDSTQGVFQNLLDRADGQKLGTF